MNLPVIWINSFGRMRARYINMTLRNHRSSQNVYLILIKTKTMHNFSCFQESSLVNNSLSIYIILDTKDLKKSSLLLINMIYIDIYC